MNGYPFMNTSIQPTIPVQQSFQQPVQPMAQYNAGYTHPLQQRKLPRVHGIEGANAYPMAPDSEEIAIEYDSSKPIEYLMITDSAGYKTVTPFLISVYKEEEPVKASDLDNRLSNITDRISKMEAWIANHEPDTKST